jgi:hypothetical protein
MKTDIRKIVIERLKAKGWSKYKLAEVELKSLVPKATTYDFLRGTSTINSDHLQIILDALDLKLS